MDDNNKQLDAVDLDEYKQYKKVKNKEKRKRDQDTFFEELEEQLDSEGQQLDPRILNKLRKR